MQVPCTSYLIFSSSILDLPFLKCIYHHMFIIWSMLFLSKYIALVCWFQAAVAAQSNIVHEVKEKTPLPIVQVGWWLYVLLPFFLRVSFFINVFIPHNNVATYFLIRTNFFIFRSILKSIVCWIRSLNTRLGLCHQFDIHTTTCL